MSDENLVTPAPPVPPADSVVLVVDDDRTVVKAMCMILGKAGYATVGCHTGKEALVAAGDHVAAAILDIHLPDMNGLKLSHELRERISPESPIIILSGDNSIETIRALPDAGATYFFAKPVNTGMLIARLREWTGP